MPRKKGAVDLEQRIRPAFPSGYKKKEAKIVNKFIFRTRPIPVPVDIRKNIRRNPIKFSNTQMEKIERIQKKEGLEPQ